MGLNFEPRPYVRTSRLLLRGLALVYAIAFVSLAVQVEGLFGSRGILPATEFLAALGSRLGDSARWALPTVFWLDAGDASLVAACWLGAASAVALFFGLLPLLSASLCWMLYLSLFQVGRVFLGFQWDVLLLEAGFLAIFLAPLRLRQRVDYDPEPPLVAVWMLRWLLFRLMFASGVVKLLSGDPSWWNLTALDFHYWTQPLPTWTAWLANQFPSLFQRSCVAAMFVVELVVPWTIFGPRRLRLAGFAPLVLLQAAIAATGNYTFFNLLTVVLCLSLLDDDALDAIRARLVRARKGAWEWPAERPTLSRALLARRAIGVVLALPLATAGGALTLARLGMGASLPKPVVALAEAIEPWHLTGSYGLFASMTKDRREIVLEGSVDGREWREYVLPAKPGDPHRRPGFVAPHQPRLDWQMWFAALGDQRRSPWLLELQRRLLEGSPAVVSLFESDPFPDGPPRLLRAQFYEYRFTDWSTRQETGAWWTRKPLGLWSPVMSAADVAVSPGR